ncbi:hypothetical protein EVAR_101400_1 [Eumeta japonica]|uniref:Uncharacterized protein n=1 Tax=Eumeta variegata TaxID=151549 RepID=A0A4C1TFY0_EUMVA|nr:hypothetical protein EVAR_101400_1 [Eumeta japonica]
MTSDISHREKLAARDVPILRRDVYTQRVRLARTMGIKSKASRLPYWPGLQFISIARGRRRPAVQVDTRDDSHDLNVLRLIDVADSRSGCCCRLFIREDVTLKFVRERCNDFHISSLQLYDYIDGHESTFVSASSDGALEFGEGRGGVDARMRVKFDSGRQERRRYYTIAPTVMFNCLTINLKYLIEQQEHGNQTVEIHRRYAYFSCSRGALQPTYLFIRNEMVSSPSPLASEKNLRGCKSLRSPPRVAIHRRNCFARYGGNRHVVVTLTSPHLERPVTVIPNVSRLSYCYAFIETIIGCSS